MTTLCRSTQDGDLEDEVTRLEKDSQAMEKMRLEAETKLATPEQPGAWKWTIRKRIWDMLEETNLACFPRPVHHRIPNFIGAQEAANMLASLPEFQQARCVKVNPDTPQKQVRFLTLSEKKLLMTPQPRLRTGFFSLLDGGDILPGPLLKECCTSAGVAKHGRPLSLDSTLRVDIIVVGSTAVDPITGARLGKGEGFAELEYGMLRQMGVIDETTPVVTTIRDEQLVDDIPIDKLLQHDVAVDIICTPTQVIRTDKSIPKPTGIYWELLSPQKLSQIKVLRDLKSRLEAERGAPLPTGPDQELPPLAERRNRHGNSGRRRGRGRKMGGGREGNSGGRS